MTILYFIKMRWKVRSLSLLLPGILLGYGFTAQAAGPEPTNWYAGDIDSHRSCGYLPPGLTLSPGSEAITGTPSATGSVSFAAKVMDAGSPAQTLTKSLSITIDSVPLVTIWPSTTVPSLVDGGPDSAVELGVKFRSDVTGTITGIRFYKAAANTGTHVGNLWSSTGTLLGTVTFADETVSGWQQAFFATPVAIASNTVYVASYHANNGHYSADLNYFAAKGFDNPPLHALTNGVSGGNGVYAYGASSAFPNQTWNAANYWVDVVFRAGSSANPDVHCGDAGEPQHHSRSLTAVHGDRNLLRR